MKSLHAKLIGLVAAGSALAVTTAAFADGMPRRAAAPRAPVEAPFSWTGFYGGANLGVHWVGDDTIAIAPNNAGTAAFFAGLIAVGNIPSRFAVDDSTGAIGGIQAGYNWQMQGVVFGIETDIQGSTAGASSSRQFGGNVAGVNEINYNTNVEWLGTVRARLGVLVSPTMLAYVTGGFAYAGVQRSFGIRGFPGIGLGQAFATTGRDTSVDTGWTIGGGLEWAITNRVTLGAEYLYVNLDSGGAIVTSPGPFGNGTCSGANQENCAFAGRSHDIDNHIARLKLNYKF